MAATTLFKVLWFLIHSFVIVCEKIYDLAVVIVNFVITFFYKSRLLDNNFQYENDYIEYNVRKLEKLPQHLVVMLGTEIPNIDSLAKLIIWSWSAGVRFISFFDHKGILKEDHLKLYEQVEKRKDPSINIVWQLKDSSYKQISKSKSHQNGTPSSSLHSNQKQNSIVVNFLCERDGKHSIGDLCQQFGYGLQNGQIKSSKEITIELIDRKLNENLNQLPDPDVAIYFGNLCSTYGLLPWQIRLTEFISIRKQNSLRLKHFLHVLFVFAKCEQRLGI